MARDFIDDLKAELTELDRKRAAVCAVLEAYGVSVGDSSVRAITAAITGSPLPRPAAYSNAAPRPQSASSRMTEYGREVRKWAADLLKNEEGPVPISLLVEVLTSLGVEIRGQDKRNALSAILSRDPTFQSHGRSGWTLRNKPAGDEPVGENGPPADSPPSGPDAEKDDGGTSSDLTDDL